MESPVLCLVVDRRFSRLPLEVAVSQAVQAGVDWIQLRERELEGQAWLDWASGIAEAARAVRPEVEIIVNRRMDIALAVDAAGVHLGFDAVTPSEARKILGSRCRIGASLHSSSEAIPAADSELDYAHLAPIFDPLSKKPERPPLGLKALQEASEGGIPLLAQGGITAENSRSVMEAGAQGIAVTGSILASPEPGEATVALRRALDAASSRPDPRESTG